MTAKLKIQNLKFRNCGPINLVINAGECISIFGKSGVGKSIFLRAIADIDPHSGYVFLNNKEQNDFSPTDWRKLVAMLPAENMWWHNRVGEHFINNKNSLIAIIKKLGFDENVFDWEVARLSTGESQRLALIRLLINKPEVLLLDEPTAGLDDKSKKIVENIIQEYLSEKKAAAILVSHDNKQIIRLANRHYLFDNGNIHLNPLK